MKYIYLTKEKLAIVDDEDYEWLMQWNWHYSGHGYAKRGTHKNINGKRKSVNFYMHREILKPQKGFIVDHINGNGLDNRRCNLRLSTKSLNAANTLKTKKKTYSIYKGVTFDKNKCKWVSQIKFRKQHNFLGYFDTQEEAAERYNSYAFNMFGEHAKLNILI